MRHTTFIAAALTAAIAFAPLAIAAPAQTAQGAAAQPAPKMQVQRRSVLEELNLTDAQKASIQQAMRSNFEVLRPQVATLQQYQEAYDTAEPGSSGYQTSVNNLANAEARFVQARVVQEGKLRSQIYGILTSSQRTKLKGLLAQQRAEVAKLRAEQQAKQQAPAASK